MSGNAIADTKNPELEPSTEVFISALAAQGGPPIYKLSVEDARGVLSGAQSGDVDKKYRKNKRFFHPHPYEVLHTSSHFFCRALEASFNPHTRTRAQKFAEVN
jgi:hypothetical protein